MERWAIIKGFPNYAISNRGRVRNLNTGRLLKHQKKSERGGGYAFVTPSRDGHKKNMMVHTLVALAFLGDRPNGKVIHHKDGNRMNPDARNLEYITIRENNHYNQKRKQSG